MEIKTFKAKSMREALEQVRRELGPSAAVLHTREVNSGPIGRLVFGRRYEVAASAGVNVPSRLPEGFREGGERAFFEAEVSDYSAERTVPRPFPTRGESFDPIPAAHLEADYRNRYRDDFRQQMAGQLDELQAMVEKLCERAALTPAHDLPETLFRAFTNMIEAEIDETVAREWIDKIRGGSQSRDLTDEALVMEKLARLLENDINVAGPITVQPDHCRVVALVGPTGVGKTTTIAKLAANYRLREKRRVGLITVDTYRVAAVEQLRTYADIIDLPMEVVATPREMREAVSRMSHLDLVLMDTAGRSPRDEVKIQELKSMLSEAEPDEVHLVLGSTIGAKSLIATAERFADVGTTALLLTKLDEAHSLGHLVSLVRDCSLPLSYLTDGQNVPDDIQVAQKRELHAEAAGDVLERVRDTGSGCRERKRSESEVGVYSSLSLRMMSAGGSAVMADQADKLREMRETASVGGGGEFAALPMVVVSGARSGVGTTTVAVNLAAVLADRGERVLLVEADQQSSGMRGAAGIRGRVEYALADVLAGDCELKQAVVDGPLGANVVLGGATVRGRARADKDSTTSLLATLSAAAGRYDTIVVDLGGSLSPMARRLWLRSQLVVAVTTPDDASVMDAYSMIKRAVGDDIRPRIGTLVNCAECESIAVDATRRLKSSCERFLTLDVHALPALPLMARDSGIQRRLPRVWEEANTDFGYAALWMGRAVEDLRRVIPDSGCGEHGKQAIAAAGFSKRKQMAA